MKKLILVLLLCVFSTSAVLSQTSEQLVKVKKKYFQNDKQLNSKEVKTILKSDPESAVAYKKSMTYTIVGGAFIGAATVLIIYSALNPPEEDENLPGIISDEEMSKWMGPVYISIGCIAASVPFLIIGNKQFKKSITIYNSKHAATGYRNELKLDIGLTQNGFGMFYKF
jgi:hypothetical protein